jgi:hypothetical protein
MPRKSRKYFRRKSRKSFRKSTRRYRKRGGAEALPAHFYTFRVNLISEVGLPVPMTNDLAELVCSHLQTVKNQNPGGQFMNYQFQYLGDNIFRVSFKDNYEGLPLGLQHTCEIITQLTDATKTLMVNANLVYILEIDCEHSANNENMNLNMNMENAMQA